MPTSYEELRGIVVDLLTGRISPSFPFDGPPQQWANLTRGVAETLERKRPPAPQQHYRYSGDPYLDPRDAELIRDVFWDLFRQGYITLGLNDSNPNWPFFRLSYFGQRSLKSGDTLRFHDTSTYLALVRGQIDDLSEAAVAYLEEAVASFYAGCHLASSVMLGVAAEAEFIRLTEAAAAGPHAALFTSCASERFIRTRITKFMTALGSVRSTLQPKKAFEDLDTNLAQIQSVIRIARNDAGHPTGAAPPSREQMYVNLQLFVPLGKQMRDLRLALS